MPLRTLPSRRTVLSMGAASLVAASFRMARAKPLGETIMDTSDFGNGNIAKHRSVSHGSWSERPQCAYS